MTSWQDDLARGHAEKAAPPTRPIASAARYEIDPIGKPRMVRGDKWKKRPAVVRYHEFKDKCRELGIRVPEQGATVTFTLPMPASWSKKKRALMLGARHQAKPDIDNLCKALLDALYEDDKGVWEISLRKVWGEVGSITITTMGG